MQIYKSYLGQDAIYNFISSMREESKYCSYVMKKHFNKKLFITKEDNEHFENPTKRWVCDSDYIDVDVKVRDYCHITGKYRGSPHRDCSISVKLNYKIPVLFQNLKKYDSHIILHNYATSTLN